MDALPKKDLSHHKQFEYCTKRPKYRDGRRLTAVKVICDQILLIIQNVVYDTQIQVLFCFGSGVYDCQ